MNRILLGVSTIAFVAAITVGATGAFFSDTETSTGNTFTAGSIDLTVDNTQHYNNAVCVNNGETSTWQLSGSSTPAIDQYPVIGSACDGTWSLVDLDTVAHKFFNFGDVKPGDVGEDTVSLHIENNPAYACVDIQTTGNNENGINEPEAAAGDISSTTGELAQNVHVFAWLDTASTSGAVAGDNIWQAGEPVLQSPVALSGFNSTTTLTLADGGTGAPLPGGATSYIGLGWCAGTISIVSPGNWTCDGSTMGNDTQTDSATTTVALRVQQARNNAGFRCSAATIVGAADLDGTSANPGVVATDGLNKWFMYNDTTDVVDNTLGTFVTGPSTPPFGTKSIQFTLGANPNDRKDIATFQFQGTPLASITALGFGAYSHSGVAGATESPFFVFNVDFTGTSTAFQKRLVYVPSTNGAVPQDSWNSYDMINGGTGKWVYSGTTWPAPNAIPGTTAKTWAQILADYPNARILPVGGFLGVRVGEPGPTNYIGNVDFVKFGVSGSTQTFDFGN